MNEAQQAYWEEVVAQSAESCGLTLTKDQLETLAYDVSAAHEHYSQAFYEPSPCDRLKEIEDEHRRKRAADRDQHERTIREAEDTFARVLGIRDGVTLGRDGAVYNRVSGIQVA